MKTTPVLRRSIRIALHWCLDDDTPFPPFTQQETKGFWIRSRNATPRQEPRNTALELQGINSMSASASCPGNAACLPTWAIASPAEGKEVSKTLPVRRRQRFSRVPYKSPFWAS